VWSNDIVNPQIIDEETFSTAQKLVAARGRGPTYVFQGRPAGRLDPAATAQ
jgi:hypothetical protein